MKVIICRSRESFGYFIYKTNFPTFFFFFKYPQPQAKLNYFNQSNFITIGKKSKNPFLHLNINFVKYIQTSDNPLNGIIKLILFLSKKLLSENKKKNRILFTKFFKCNQKQQFPPIFSMGVVGRFYMLVWRDYKTDRIFGLGALFCQA